MARCSIILGIFILETYWSVTLLVSSYLPTEGHIAFPTAEINEWLYDYNHELEILKHESALALWKNLLDPGPLSVSRLEHANAAIARWQRQKVAEAERLRYLWLRTGHLREYMKAPDRWQHRMLHLITRGPRYTSAMARSLASLVSRMRAIYGNVNVTHQNTTYRSEKDFTHIMRTCRDPNTLERAWEDWHQAVGPPIKSLFTQAVTIMNQAARLGGYQDMGEAWRAEIDLGDGVDVRNIIKKLYNQIYPFYSLLHAYVRHSLMEKYGKYLVDTSKPIPTHLLGDLWGQDWEALGDLMHPEASKPSDMSNADSMNFTARDMVEEANTFFVGLDFPKLPENFWALSVLGSSEVPSNATCHPRALDMYAPDDYRLLFCEGERTEIPEMAYHELGHIYYFHAYNRQPTIFRDGANSAAHETIGDAVQLAAMAQKTHMTRDGKKSDVIKGLLKTALRKLPLLAFARVVDEWRWDVFQGKINHGNYNKAWWTMKRRYQGVMAPSTRSEKHFDPGAKFHVPDNTPYIRYFIAVIAQFQVHKRLCEVADKSQPLHSCTIANSREAGKLLWTVLSRGSSLRWKEFLQELTGSSELNALPLLEYFEPLTQWLLQELKNKNATIGWRRITRAADPATQWD